MGGFLSLGRVHQTRGPGIKGGSVAEATAGVTEPESKGAEDGRESRAAVAISSHPLDAPVNAPATHAGPSPVLQIIRDASSTRKIFVDLVSHSKVEALLLLPSLNAFLREVNIGLFDAMGAAALRGVKCRVLTPLDAHTEDTLGAMNKILAENKIEYRPVPPADTPNTVTVLVVDRHTSLVIEQKDGSKMKFEEAIGAATYSTSNSTVTAAIRFFEQLWDEVGLLDRESRSRRTSELLQDIMAHDIRNYNQVSRTGVEILKMNFRELVDTLAKLDSFTEEIAGALEGPPEILEQAQRLRDALRKSARNLDDANAILEKTIEGIDGSTRLIERAKKLGRIVAQKGEEVQPVSLENSIRRSVEVVELAYPDKKILLSLWVEPSALVLADELLDELFTNVLTNAVKYTEGNEVPIAIEAEEDVSTAGGKEGYWKITFTDHGRGIPDSLKRQLFARYLKTAHGTGLGLSIVYALAVETYGGQVRITNRVANDHTKGTRVRIWLRKA